MKVGLLFFAVVYCDYNLTKLFGLNLLDKILLSQAGIENNENTNCPYYNISKIARTLKEAYYKLRSKNHCGTQGDCKSWKTRAEKFANLEKNWSGGCAPNSNFVKVYW